MIRRRKKVYTEKELSEILNKWSDFEVSEDDVENETDSDVDLNDESDPVNVHPQIDNDNIEIIGDLDLESVLQNNRKCKSKDSLVLFIMYL